MAKIYFLGPRPQGQGIFRNFMILLDLLYDLRENEVLFVEIGAKVLDLSLDTFLSPNA